MRYSFLFFLFLLMLGVSSCISTKEEPSARHSVTMDTSGEIYSEDGGSNSQIDFFGQCLPGQDVIYVEVNKKTTPTRCFRGRYRVSVNIPSSFFQQLNRIDRSPAGGKKQKIEKVNVYHRGFPKDTAGVKASSFLHIDSKNRVIIRKIE